MVDPKKGMSDGEMKRSMKALAENIKLKGRVLNELSRYVRLSFNTTRLADNAHNT